jgi:hypothetical protein
VIPAAFLDRRIHHRAQANTLLSQLGYTPAVRDLYRVSVAQSYIPVLATNAGSAR